MWIVAMVCMAVIAIVAVTAMQLRIYHHSNNPHPPSWIKRFSGCVHKITCRRNKNQVVSVNTEQEFEEFKEDIIYKLFNLIF
jgi:hypothetical protein